MPRALGGKKWEDCLPTGELGDIMMQGQLLQAKCER